MSSKSTVVVNKRTTRAYYPFIPPHGAYLEAMGDPQNRHVVTIPGSIWAHVEKNLTLKDSLVASLAAGHVEVYETNSAILRVVPVTSNKTVSVSESGTHFTTRGATTAVTFTLPTTFPPGCRFRFTNEVDQNMTISCTSRLVTRNNASANSVSFQTTSDRIGGSLEVVSNDNASKWIVLTLSPNAITVA